MNTNTATLLAQYTAGAPAQVPATELRRRLAVATTCPLCALAATA